MPTRHGDSGRASSEKISFLREIGWLDLWWPVAILLIWLFATGFSNAVNITDGLDGLAAGSFIVHIDGRAYTHPDDIAVCSGTATLRFFARRALHAA